MKWVLTQRARCQRIMEGKVVMVLDHECYQVQFITVGDWPVQDETCSRNQLLTGGRRGRRADSCQEERQLQSVSTGAMVKASGQTAVVS